MGICIQGKSITIIVDMRIKAQMEKKRKESYKIINAQANPAICLLYICLLLILSSNFPSTHAVRLPKKRQKRRNDFVFVFAKKFAKVL